MVDNKNQLDVTFCILYFSSNGEIFSVIYVGLHGKCLLLLSNFNQNQNV